MFKKDKTYVFALGGLGEVGKNMYCIYRNDEIIIISSLCIKTYIFLPTSPRPPRAKTYVLSFLNILISFHLFFIKESTYVIILLFFNFVYIVTFLWYLFVV